jgi:hypothetical protein
VQSPANSATTLAKLSTSCDSLIIEVTGPDIGTLRFSKFFDLTQSVQADTLKNIPTGSNRQIKVYTIDRSGTVITTDTNSQLTIRIDPNVTTQLNVVLLPAAGSIYLQLENIPTKYIALDFSTTPEGLGFSGNWQ